MISNPLDDFVGSKPSTNDLRLNDPPLLGPLIEVYGLKQGVKMFDSKLNQWKMELERALNERLAGKEQIQTSTVQ